MKLRSWVILAACAMLLASARAEDARSSSLLAAAGATEEKTLYERLGGEQAIRAVCEDFVGRAAVNPKVNFFRKNIPGVNEWKPSEEELARFNKHLVQFVCKAAGGPQVYEGRSMKEAHAGMKITAAEFEALAADLAASLEKFNVPEREKNELLAAVAATRPDIVEVEN